jgi:hypothetical protein
MNLNLIYQSDEKQEKEKEKPKPKITPKDIFIMGNGKNKKIKKKK